VNAGGAGVDRMAGAGELERCRRGASRSSPHTLLKREGEPDGQSPKRVQFLCLAMHPILTGQVIGRLMAGAVSIF